jgi:hypothetical protein
VEKKLIDKERLIEPKNMPKKEHLLSVHTPEYLKSLDSSRTVAAITESTLVVMYLPILARFV